MKFGKYIQTPVKNKFRIVIVPKPLVRWELSMIHLKITSKKKLFQNFIIIANFYQFGMLCNIVYLTTENKQIWKAFFNQSEGDNSQILLIMCQNVGCKKVFKYWKEKNPHNLWKIITNAFSILTWVSGTNWSNLSLFSLKKSKANNTVFIWRCNRLRWYKLR